MTTTTDKPSNQEQAADLAALTAAAAGEGAPAGPGAPGAPADKPAEIAPQSQQAMALAGMLVGMAKPLICYAVPALKKAPAELWLPVPEGVAAVLDHYNLGESEFMRNPWARLAFSVAPLAAYAAMTAEEKPAEPERLAAPAASAPPQAGEGAGSKNVTFGAPVPAET